MPVVSLNTSGARPMKPESVVRKQDLGAAVHWDSRVDKFNKRLELVRACYKDRPTELRDWEAEVKEVSLYEFFWKYNVFKGSVKRCARPVALMVTPSFSADCAGVEHANHENYARTAVVAYWRHMSTEQRRAEIQKTAVMQAINEAFIGATPFEQPSSDRYLGVLDLAMKFETGRRGPRWGLALLEMLVDPLLSLWVPAWVREQFERANPYFADVLREFAARRFRSNAALLRALRREMVRRHRRNRRKQ